jgi:hypothetical protein
MSTKTLMDNFYETTFYQKYKLQLFLCATFIFYLICENLYLALITIIPISWSIYVVGLNSINNNQRNRTSNDTILEKSNIIKSNNLLIGRYISDQTLMFSYESTLFDKKNSEKCILPNQFMTYNQNSLVNSNNFDKCVLHDFPIKKWQNFMKEKDLDMYLYIIETKTSKQIVANKKITIDCVYNKTFAYYVATIMSDCSNQEKLVGLIPNESYTFYVTIDNVSLLSKMYRLSN